MARWLRGQNPTDFGYLLTEKVGKEQAILVGGQAVNLWALLFVEDEPELERFRPFTSKDCDVVASPDWTRKIADQHGLKCKTFRAGQASPAVGIIFVTLADNKATELQVLRNVAGLRPKEIREATSRIEIDGNLYQVIDPIALLKAKLSNMLRLDQTDRQDSKHVFALCCCIRSYLRRRLNQLRLRNIAPRDCIRSLEAALKVVLSPNARRVGRKLDLDFSNIFPQRELRDSSNSAIKNFVDKRLPRVGLSL